MQFFTQVTLYKRDGNVDTAIAQDDGECVAAFSDAAEEFEELTECDVSDCLLVDLAKAGIDASELVEAGEAESEDDGD